MSVARNKTTLNQIEKRIQWKRNEKEKNYQIYDIHFSHEHNFYIEALIYTFYGK